MLKPILEKILNDKDKYSNVGIEELALQILEDYILHGNTFCSWAQYHGLQNQVDDLHRIRRDTFHIVKQLFWCDEVNRDRAAFILAAALEDGKYAGLTIKSLNEDQKREISASLAIVFGNRVDLPYISYLDISGIKPSTKSSTVGMYYDASFNYRLSRYLPEIFGQSVQLDYQRSPVFADFDFDTAYASLAGFNFHPSPRHRGDFMNPVVLDTGALERNRSGELSQKFTARIWVPGCHTSDSSSGILVQWRDIAGPQITVTDNYFEGGGDYPFKPAFHGMSYSWLINRGPRI